VNETAKRRTTQIGIGRKLGCRFERCHEKIGCHYYLTSGADATFNYHLLGVKCLTDKVTIRLAKTGGNGHLTLHFLGLSNISTKHQTSPRPQLPRQFRLLQLLQIVQNHCKSALTLELEHSFVDGTSDALLLHLLDCETELQYLPVFCYQQEAWSGKRFQSSLT